MDDNMQEVTGSGSRFGTSWSGCSSGIGTSASHEKDNRKVTEKRKQVRKCIAELRSLVDSQKGQRSGTLNTLQNVLAHLKKTKDEPEGTDTGNSQYDAERLGVIDGETQRNRFSVPLPADFHGAKEAFKYKIFLGLKRQEVVHVSDDLLHMLGYPKNFWYQHPITQFVYKKDLVTVASNLSFSATSPARNDEDDEKEKNVFFFRLRHFKSLRQGFSLNRPNRFSVFYAKASVQEITKETTSTSLKETDSLQEGQYIVLDLKLMQSAYKAGEANTTLDQRTFSIRHTVTCNYNFVHPSAIALLGYLPQDILGASVFDFYHPHDLPVLLGIYQEVMSRPGQTYKSIMYRMKVHNGSYLTVETEWSSFINPWTHKLDFIIGQSEVILGPDNPDVFMDCVPTKTRENISLERQQSMLTKQIRALLMQNVTEPPQVVTDHRDNLLSHLPHIPSPTDTTTNTPITISFSSSKESDQQKSPKIDEQESISSPSPMVQEDTKEPDLVSDDGCPGEPTPTDDDDSDVNFPDDQKVLIYQRLNYVQNIRRFLMSCHSNSGSGTTVDSSEDLVVKDSTSSENATAESTTDFSVNMDITLAKLPSFASSTKAMISEHEQREEHIPDESEVETAHTPKDPQATPSNPATPAPPPVVTSVEEVYTPVHLTEAVLKNHNKIQEQGYINKMMIENRLMSTASGDSGKDSCGESSKRMCKKRKTQGSDTGVATHKHFRGNNMMESSSGSQLTSEVLPIHAPFNVPPDARMGVTVTSTSGPPFSISLPVLSTSSANIQMPGAYRGTTTVPQMVQLSVSLAQTEQGLQSVRWPVYNPQTGMPIMQSFIYQPVAGQIVQQPPPRGHVFTPSTTTSSGDMNISGQSHNTGPCKAENNDSGCKNEESNEESSSSFAFLMESSAGNSENSDGPSMSGVTKAPLPSAPPWLQDCQWNNAVKMQYTMPKRKAKAVLTENKVVLQRMKQSIDVVNQMQELLGEMNDKDYIFDDEEADLLFWADDRPAMDKSETTSCSSNNGRSGGKEMSQLQESIVPGVGQHSGGDNRKKTEEESTGGDYDSEASSALDKLDISEERSSTHDEAGPARLGTLNKNDENMETGSDRSVDRCSKSSSCITPSDERSNEEAGSSLKESDNTSSEENEQHHASKSDGYSSADSDDTDDQDGAVSDAGHVGKKKLAKLFVPLHIQCEEDCIYDQKSGRGCDIGSVSALPTFSPTLVPQWLMDIDFNERVQMQYTSPPLSKKDILEEDKRRIESMRQPELVKAQMSELFVALRKQVGEALDVGALDVEYHGSSSDVSMNTPPHARSLNSEPMVEGQGSPTESDDPEHATHSTSSGTEMMKHHDHKSRMKKSGQGKGGPVKRSTRKSSKAYSVNNIVTTRGEGEAGYVQKSTDADSGTEMLDETGTPREKLSSASCLTSQTPTTSENSPEYWAPDTISAMSPSGSANANTVEVGGASVAFTSPPSAPTEPASPLSNGNLADHYDVTDNVDANDDDMHTSDLLGTLFTDDDKSNL